MIKQKSLKDSLSKVLLRNGCLKNTNNHRNYARYNDYYEELRKICNIELFTTQRLQSLRLIREEEVGFLIDSYQLLLNYANLSEKLSLLVGTFFVELLLERAPCGFCFFYLSLVRLLKYLDGQIESIRGFFLNWILFAKN